jgi:predicted kinase
MLIIVTGLPGAGKTTFAEALAGAIQARHFNSDKVRDALGKRGQYDEATKEAIYNEMEKLTQAALSRKESVVLDATFYKESLRRPYVLLAGECDAHLFWIEVKASEASIRRRVEEKRRYSEADFEVYLQIKRIWEPMQSGRLVLWSDELSIEEMVGKAKDYLKLVQI